MRMNTLALTHIHVYIRIGIYTHGFWKDISARSQGDTPLHRES